MTDQPQLFNSQAVLNLLQGDVDLLAELVEMTEEEAGEALSHIDQALRDKDLTAVCFQSHRLRSALSNLGAESCCILLLELEREAKQEALVLGRKKFERLGIEIEAYFTEVKAFLQQS